MTKRIQRLVVAVAALAALALGGAVFAQAQSSPSAAAQERTTAPDRDNVQSGDQTTPDTKAPAVTHARFHAVRAASTTSTDPAGGGSGQSGSQSTPDTGSGTETTTAEKPETGAGSESASPSDGPGGHADEPGNASADHQFQGNE
jgi:hypothetical protein